MNARQLSFLDMAALASIGLRTRKLRAALSALGISIGVGAIVAVLGLASSSPKIPAIETNAIGVHASSPGLPSIVGTSVAQGACLNAGTAREPVAVLGYAAAQRLGIVRVWAPLPGSCRPSAPPGFPPSRLCGVI